MRNAPHLVEVMPFLIPILTKDGVVRRKLARALGSAMWMYDVAGGWRIGRLHHRVSAARAAAHFPAADPDRLRAGYVYYDAATDDARLTLTVARTAADHGAVVVNRCPVVEVTTDARGLASGVVVEADGERVPVAARAVVSATGVWSDRVRALDEGPGVDSIRPAKGVHLTVPWELVRNDIAVIIPVRRDRRSLFLVPWGRRADGTFRFTYIGTTDTDHAGSLDDPQCEPADVDYVLGALNEAIDGTVTPADVTGVWAGLRPLVRPTADAGDAPRTADLSRRHVVEISSSGIVRVNGGKLTTYRAMAEDTVDAVVARLPGAPDAWARHPTRRLRLTGATGRRRGAPGSWADHLDRRYGGLAGAVEALIAEDPTLDAPLVDGLPYRRAEAVHAARHEMATTVGDVLVRRTRAHLFDRAASLAAAPDVADLLAAELGWDDDVRRRRLDEYRRCCRDEEEAGARHVADLAD
jgi:glycerol-3-phosphate dehydrogenase